MPRLQVGGCVRENESGIDRLIAGWMTDRGEEWGFFGGGSGLWSRDCVFSLAYSLCPIMTSPLFCFSNESFDGCYISPICDSLRRSVRIQQSSVWSGIECSKYDLPFWYSCILQPQQPERCVSRWFAPMYFRLNSPILSWLLYHGLHFSTSFQSSVEWLA